MQNFTYPFWVKQLTEICTQRPTKNTKVNVPLLETIQLIYSESLKQLCLKSKTSPPVCVCAKCTFLVLSDTHEIYIYLHMNNVLTFFDAYVIKGEKNNVMLPLL